MLKVSVLVLTSRLDYPQVSTLRGLWPNRKWNFTFLDGLNAVKKIRYRKFFYDLHIRIPCRFDQDNKKISVIYTLTCWPITMICYKFRFRIKKIETASNTKLLGIHLDSSLTWAKHVAVISNKICKRVGLLKRLKQFLALRARLAFYNALVQPLMDYFACVWGGGGTVLSPTLIPCSAFRSVRPE